MVLGTVQWACDSKFACSGFRTSYAIWKQNINLHKSFSWWWRDKFNKPSVSVNPVNLTTPSIFLSLCCLLLQRAGKFSPWTLCNRLKVGLSPRTFDVGWVIHQTFLRLFCDAAVSHCFKESMEGRGLVTLAKSDDNTKQHLAFIICNKKSVQWSKMFLKSFK